LTRKKQIPPGGRLKQNFKGKIDYGTTLATAFANVAFTSTNNESCQTTGFLPTNQHTPPHTITRKEKTKTVK
jgi:hypothetical protein